MAILNEFERDRIAERTSSILQHRKANRRAYAPVPYGYDRIGDELIKNPGELETVETMKLMREEGKSYSHIAEHLNSTGVATKNDKRWHGSTVRYILKNDLYR